PTPTPLQPSATPLPPPPPQPYPAYGPPPSYPYAPPAGYYPGHYPGPMAPATRGHATASLIFAITRFLPIPILGSILGIILGIVALNQIRGSNGQYEGQGLATTGIVIGAVGLLIGIALCMLLAVAIGNTDFSQGQIAPNAHLMFLLTRLPGV